MDKANYCNCENFVTQSLTEKPQGATLENVPSNSTWHNLKQIEGGNVTDTQPPALSGFFMPAVCPCDCNKLPGIATHKIPLCGKSCGSLFEELQGSRQFYYCQNLKKIEEVNAMHCENHAIGAPAPTDKGLLSPILLPAIPAPLLEVIAKAKSDHAATGKANAYALLLEHFHRAILTAFFAECKGNLSEVSRLLGIHRESVRKYALAAGVDTSNAAIAGGAK